MTNNIPINLVIIGLGNIGIRHLQSLLKSKIPINIYLYDLNLNKAKNFIYKSSYEKSFLKIFLLKNINQIPPDITLCIVSTPSKNRISIFNELDKHKNIRFLLLEKVLSSSKNELNIFSKNQNNFEKIFVNMPYHFQEIFDLINKELPNAKEVTFKGNNFGIACNLVHLIDISEKIFQKKITSFTSKNKNLFWKESTRNGYYDLSGDIELTIPDGYKVNIISNKLGKSDIEIIVKNNFETIRYDWEKGCLIKNNSLISNTKITFQSSRTLDILLDLIAGDNPKVSTLENAIRIHYMLIDILQPSWDQFIRDNKQIALKCYENNMLIT